MKKASITAAFSNGTKARGRGLTRFAEDGYDEEGGIEDVIDATASQQPRHSPDFKKESKRRSSIVAQRASTAQDNHYNFVVLGAGPVGHFPRLFQFPSILSHFVYQQHLFFY